MTQRYSAFTLVDITPTNINRARDSNKREYHQQQNLNVLMQTIGLRTQVYEPEVIILPNQSLAGTKFGKKYSNQIATVWRLNFQVEYDMVWHDQDDPFSLLISDANNIAITSDLDNTVDFSINVFDTSNDINLFFEVN